MLPQFTGTGVVGSGIKRGRRRWLTERVNFQVRAEFLNGFNHPWFSRLDGNATDVTRPTFGWYRRQEGNQMRLIAIVGKLVW